MYEKNFFLYFEEFDLCKSLINLGKNIFTAQELKIHHLGFKSSINKDEQNSSNMIKLKDWHYMWSSFYFYKKNGAHVLDDWRVAQMDFNAIKKFVNNEDF